MKRFVIILWMCLFADSCAPQLPTEPDLFVDFEIIENPIVPLIDSAQQAAMNGVYDVVEGSDLLGSPVVGKWIGVRWCLFSQHDAAYSENAGGVSSDSSIKLSGYIRAIRSGGGVRVRFQVSKDDGAAKVIAGQNPMSLRIEGRTAEGRNIELVRSRAIYPNPAGSDTFHILAHRGGGRNSDRLGISENSLAMIEHAAYLGATGVEIDVKQTRDHQLIVFHDDSFSPRTVQGVYLLGKVEGFDLQQIRSFGRLVNGEPIPTLSEALKAVVTNTPLSLVWLDVKDPSTVDQALRIQQEWMDSAVARGRKVDILLGIPSDEVLKAYRASPFKGPLTRVLIEIDPDIAIEDPNCRAWAPIWTTRIDADVDRVRNAGKWVFPWTVDLRESIAGYLKEEGNRRVSGILSNYPTLVSGVYHTK